MATQEKWGKFYINPWWGNKHRELDYKNEPFNDSKSLDTWKQLGYTQTKFTGDMYDMRNPMPEWVRGFREYFTWKYFSWSVYKMGPGCVLPEHSDTYNRFREIHKITNYHNIIRAVVFLEDWQQGHYFDVDNTPLVSWKAGDVVWWYWDTPHTAANIGTTDRYTLQITGLKHERIVL